MCRTEYGPFVHAPLRTQAEIPYCSEVRLDLLLNPNRLSLAFVDDVTDQ